MARLFWINIGLRQAVINLDDKCLTSFANVIAFPFSAKYLI